MRVSLAKREELSTYPLRLIAFHSRFRFKLKQKQKSKQGFLEAARGVRHVSLSVDLGTTRNRCG
jgi:hypothetical protein